MVTFVIMAQDQKQMVIIYGSLFDLLYNNGMLNVLIKIISMRQF